MTLYAKPMFSTKELFHRMIISVQNRISEQFYCVPEPEALLGVAGPQGAQQHRAHRHQEDQHCRVVEGYVIPKQK